MTEQDGTNNSENKVRVMSPRGFLAKSNSRKVADNKQDFLMAYRTWLSTPEKLKQLTDPIFVKWESNSFTLDEAFSALQQAVVDYIFLSELDNLKENQEKKAQAAIKKQEEETRKKNAPPRAERKPAAWMAAIYNIKDEIQTRINNKGEEEELIKGFQTSVDADSWAMRRIIECSPDCFAIITQVATNLTTRIDRNDAFANSYKREKRPFMKNNSKRTVSKLGWGVKLHPTRNIYTRP